MSDFFEQLNNKMDNLGEQEYSLIPDGWYTATIKDVNIKPTKDGTGKIMNFRFDITGPSHSNRVVFAGLNVQNRNPQTEEMAQRDLKAIRTALGMSMIKNTEQLIGKNLKIKVGVQKGSGDYPDKNTPKSYAAIEGSQMPTASQSKPKAPWETKDDVPF
jgi:hypothetical protein